MKRVWFDTETTALTADPEHGRICQLAYLVGGESGTLCAKNFFFAVPPGEMSEGSSKITGLTEESLLGLSGGRTFGDDAKEILADFAGAVCFAHNFRFDYHFLQTECERIGTLLHYRRDVCTAKTFAKIFRLPSECGGFRQPKLTQLCTLLEVSEDEIGDFCKRYFGIEGRWHDARFDASAVCLAVMRAEEMGKFRLRMAEK